MSGFEASHEEALDFIVSALNSNQLHLITGCLIEGQEDSRRVLVDGHEGTIKSLLVREVPLVIQDGRDRLLTPLGLDVARHYIRRKEERR